MTQPVERMRWLGSEAPAEAWLRRSISGGAIAHEKRDGSFGGYELAIAVFNDVRDQAGAGRAVRSEEADLEQFAVLKRGLHLAVKFRGQSALGDLPVCRQRFPERAEPEFLFIVKRAGIHSDEPMFAARRWQRNLRSCLSPRSLSVPRASA